jgi:phage gp46-like protein
MPTPWNDISLGNPNPTTGAFNFVRGADGDVQFDDSGAHGVLTSVIERLGTNPFDSSHGSNIWQIRSLTSKTPSQTEASALAAVQPMVSAGEIQGVATDAAANSQNPNRLDLDVSWTSGTGKPQSKTTQV